MTRPKVLINGIQAVDMVKDQRTGSADLWELGGVFIVRCNVNEEGAIQWYGAPPSSEHIIIIDGEFFERDGVIVVDKTEATLSDEAVDYIRKWEPEWSPR